MTSSANYRTDIDGLRAVAVAAVVLHHIFPDQVTGGYIGVDVFFVISGYLITSIIRSEISSGTFSFAHFYERRARRIFPALFVVLGVTLLAGHALLLPTDLRATLRAAIGTVLFSSNMVFWRDLASGYFAATDAGLNPLLHTWSLAVEEQYYVLFPLFLLAMHRWRSRWIVPALLVVFAGSFILATALVQTKTVAVFFLSPFRAWELLAGSLLAYRILPEVKWRPVREAVALVGLSSILAGCVLYNRNTTFPAASALVPVLGAAAIIHAGSTGASTVTKLLSIRPFVLLGLISYSLYLWHWPLVAFTRYATGLAPAADHSLFLLFSSISLATLSYKFVEQPFRRKTGFPMRHVLAASATSIACLGAIGIAGLMMGGYEGRFSKTIVELDRARAPAIPFVSCDSQPISNACVIGSSTPPDTILWGDSHMLAWAPVFHKIYKERGQSALLASNSACPPLPDALGAAPECKGRNSEILEYLSNHPEIRTVVLAAYWSTYSTNVISSKAAARDSQSESIRRTVRLLRGTSRRVIMLGPVPVYPLNVPLAQALEGHLGKKLLSTNAAQQRLANAGFYGAANEPGADFADPISWLCTSDCLVSLNGKSLYRDAHHLSVDGALYLEGELRNLLTHKRPEANL